MKTLAPLLPTLIVLPIGVIAFEGPLAKLIWGTLGLLFLLKIGALIRNRQHSLPLPIGLGWLVYLFMWPGMRPEVFARREVSQESVGRVFVTGFVFFVGGILTQLALALWWESINSDVRLYLGLLSFLVLIHFGFSSILFVFYRLLGWPVEPLFRSPFQSASLREFWGQRWNLAFVDMDKRLFLPLFSKRFCKAFAMFGIFLVSGILHEIGVSYPAGDGWGLPLIYFVIHGALTLIEPAIPLINGSFFLKRIWVWVALLAPLPLLFHKPFLTTFIQPYFEAIHTFLSSVTTRELLYWALLACGVGHLLILVASFQVPKKLNWKTEFSRLGSFNQKIFWTYGGYIVCSIIAFALVDLFNAQGLLESGASSIAIAAYIALFWTVRVIVDFTYFKHNDWPQGDVFVVGHTCLTALFGCLAITHWALIGWHLV